MFPNEEYKPFPKVPRIFRDCIITEKIDGTNACVFIQEGNAYAASRKRWIAPNSADNPQADNYGFARWVQDNAEELIEGLGDGYHFGEWYGWGIQNNPHDLPKNKQNFALFNTGLWTPETKPGCCSVVPVLFQGRYHEGCVAGTMEYLEGFGSLVDGAGPHAIAEGVMIYMVTSGYIFKATYDDSHKESTADAKKP